VVSDYAFKFMERNKERPFLLYYPMILTHQPFAPTPDSADWGKNKGDNVAVEYFPDMVAYMDKLVGKLARKLDELGLRENTIVMFTGDNGTPTPCTSMCNGKPIKGGKGGMGDGGTHVPLIVSWPRHIKKGKVLNDLVDFSDFLPTCCEAGGAEVPAELKIDGRSFLPQLKGGQGSPREWIYCWHARDGGPTGSEWARNQRYKMKRGGGVVEVLPDGQEVAAKADDPEAQRARPILQAALDKYQDARPESFKNPAGKKP
jgi:arylsulfatase A